ncbi:MAG: hypothetical protein ACR2OV_15960 [Hyphomicrobiaceae bacterium]
MNDHAKVAKAASKAEDPNSPQQRMQRAMLDIYKLGMRHAAYLLRGSDAQGITNQQLDIAACLIEFDVSQRDSIANWEV